MVGARIDGSVCLAESSTRDRTTLATTAQTALATSGGNAPFVAELGVDRSPMSGV